MSDEPPCPGCGAALTYYWHEGPRLRHEDPCLEWDYWVHLLGGEPSEIERAEPERSEGVKE